MEFIRKYFPYAEKLGNKLSFMCKFCSTICGIEALNGDQSEVNNMIKEFKKEEFSVEELNKIENINVSSLVELLCFSKD